ncbi:dnaJ homolog subfamily B member 9 [Chanos chanos]|uniref:DnaJ homolog subfamily B member 9 n=1 Tax=Chanos chanos TaxID=29144 RepID=A0A6J2VRD8_CHACN|nr:dnaJ homolog subfamily B member 9-like [Chanos chanos]
MAGWVFLLLVLCLLVCECECVKDYYAVLGVPHTATEGQIKRAFRGLAMKHHPDRNRRSDAPQIFTQIAQAYEVLSDARRRRLYDQVGHTSYVSPRGEREGDKGSRDPLGDHRHGKGNSGGFYGNGIFPPFSSDELLQMLQVEEEELFEGVWSDMDQGWSFTFGGEDDGDDHDEFWDGRWLEEDAGFY